MPLPSSLKKGQYLQGTHWILKFPPNDVLTRENSQVGKSFTIGTITWHCNFKCIQASNKIRQFECAFILISHYSTTASRYFGPLVLVWMTSCKMTKNAKILFPGHRASLQLKAAIICRQTINIKVMGRRNEVKFYNFTLSQSIDKCSFGINYNSYTYDYCIHTSIRVAMGHSGLSQILYVV